MSERADVLVLQHIACEPPAAYGEELDRRGIAFRSVALDEGQALPDWRPYRAIIAMGGPMGAYDEPTLPWLAGEKRLIGEAARAGRPFWGVCLGAQLLAAGLGARVLPGPLPEVGVMPVQLSAAGARDPVFSAAPASFQSFHWHGDTYELPAGAVRLAGSALYEQQAFVFQRAYGLQFHLEVDAGLVAGWGRVPAYAESLRRRQPPLSIAEVTGQLGGVQAQAIPLARELFARWLDRVACLPGVVAA